MSEYARLLTICNSLMFSYGVGKRLFFELIFLYILAVAYSITCPWGTNSVCVVDFLLNQEDRSCVIIGSYWLLSVVIPQIVFSSFLRIFMFPSSEFYNFAP